MSIAILLCDILTRSPHMVHVVEIAGILLQTHTHTHTHTHTNTHTQVISPTWCRLVSRIHWSSCRICDWNSRRHRSTGNGPTAQVLCGNDPHSHLCRSSCSLRTYCGTVVIYQKLIVFCVYFSIASCSTYILCVCVCAC